MLSCLLLPCSVTNFPSVTRKKILPKILSQVFLCALCHGDEEAEEKLGLEAQRDSSVLCVPPKQSWLRVSPTTRVIPMAQKIARRDH